MADHGVPLQTGDHRLQCLFSCVEQQLDIQAFKKFIYSRTGKHVNTSMGVNTGFVSAGNMGSDKKMQYTIMGDTVNTPPASVLQTGSTTIWAVLLLVR